MARVLIPLLLLPTSGARAQGLIDHVWSGHPVSFALLVDDARGFLPYYDAERRLTVGSRDVAGAEWTIMQPAGGPVPKRGRDSNVTSWDSHNFLRLVRDRDGHVHFAGKMHSDRLVYHRTRVAGDITTLERIDRMTGERENECTYPMFFHDAVGALLFRYRDGGSGRGSGLYNRHDPATRS